MIIIQNKPVKFALTLFSVVFGFMVSLASVYAETSMQDTDDASFDAFEDLMSVLSKETEIATKTKMNIDFVPGMVTVLHGKDLKARGISNVFSALKLVPGIDTSIAGDGQQQLVVRGVGKVFGSGKVKVLINGVPFNSNFTAQVSLVSIPIEQVERIEVVRGPGSAVYGEYAFAGVINVITRDDTTEFFTRYGDLNTRIVGGMYSRKSEEHDYSVSLNMASSKSNPNNVMSGEDALFGTPIEGLSNSPGPVNDNVEDNSLMLKFDYKDMSFIFESLDRGFGNFFGANDRLPPADAGIVRRITFDVFEFNTPLKIMDMASSKLTVRYADQSFDATDQMVAPAGFQGQFPDGVLASPHYEEEKYYVGLDLHFTSLGDHDVVAGIEYSYTDQGDTYIERNFAQNPAAPPQFIELSPSQVFTGQANWMAEGNDRKVFGIFAQDQYSVNEKLNLTAGLRFDHYDDVGHSFTPRFAGVYQLSDNQTIKLQYAEAFRPPTFLELYSQNNIIVSGNPDLSAETIKSIEAGYVYNNGVTVGRVTMFVAELKDLIGGGSNAPVVFENIGQARQNGLELELAKQISHQFKVDSNLSYVNVKDDITGEEFANIANVIANIGLTYQPEHNNAVNLQYRYTGKRDRDISDTRPTISATNTLDITASIFNYLVRDMTFRIGVTNVLGEDIVTPSPPNTYVDDYPQPGREIWLSLEYSLR